MLESLQHTDNAFVTLTYDDEHIPDGGSLHAEDLKGFLKRLRRAIEPARLRYFGVGEYGDRTERPHYHIALFGFPACEAECAGAHRDGKAGCYACDLIRRAWKRGFIVNGTLTVESAQYIAGYVTKKMTSRDDVRLDGRYPEFARMSLKPGIGADATHEIASKLMQYDLDEVLEDVPGAVRYGARSLPLGRYLKRLVRERIGRDGTCPPEIIEAMEKEVQPLRDAALGGPGPMALKELAFLNAVAEKSLGRVRSIEFKSKLKRRKL